MPYGFVEPTILADQGVTPRHVRARPEVYTGTPLSRASSRRLASTILQGHEAGMSWESRTRYAPNDSAQWDVNRTFRSSRNISPTLEGLEEAYAAM